jgi:hypothetical protein
MVQLVIAGPAGSLDFAEMELLVAIFEELDPTLVIFRDYVHPSDWPAKRERLFRSRGFVALNTDASICFNPDEGDGPFGDLAYLRKLGAERFSYSVVTPRK